MRIVALYSHLNGEEYLLVHRKELWEEVQEVVGNVDASKLKTKVSKERRTEGKVLYSPKAMNEAFRNEFRTKGWSEHQETFWVTVDENILRQIYTLPAEEQKQLIEEAGFDTKIASLASRRLRFSMRCRLHRWKKVKPLCGKSVCSTWANPAPSSATGLS